MFEHYFASNRLKWLGKTQNKIVLMGSSTVKTGLSAEVIQKELNLEYGDVVNLGMMPNNPIKSYYLLKENIKYFPKDFMLIYGFDPWIYSTKYYKYESIMLCKLNIIERMDMFLSDENIFGLLGGSIRRTAKTMLVKETVDNIPLHFGTKDWSISDKNASNDFPNWVDYPKYDISEIYLLYNNKIKMLVEANGGTMAYYLPPRRIDYLYVFDKLLFRKVIFDKLDNDSIIINFEYKLSELNEDMFVDPCHLTKTSRDYVSKELAISLKKHTKIWNK